MSIQITILIIILDLNNERCYDFKGLSQNNLFDFHWLELTTAII